MDNIRLIFFGLVALIAGCFVWARVKYGSWTGAFLKGSIEQTFGEIALTGRGLGSQMMKVVALKNDDGEAFVGLIITAKAPLAMSLTPYRLSKDQARELAGLLNLAGK